MNGMTDSRAVEVLAEMRKDGGTVEEADYTAAIDHAIARLREPAGGAVRLWDSQWSNIVNAPEVLNAESQEDAVSIAVRMAEAHIAKNVAAGNLPPTKSAPQPPAEAQAQGGGEAELRRMVAKLAAHVRPTCGELWAEAERLLNRTAPPSAPVGVEGLLERWRKESRRLYAEHLKSMALRPLGQSDAYDACRAELSALAQQPAAVDEAMAGWIADGDTIPDYLIEATRVAIRLEFGNNGTDGYYKRILVRVFRALAAQHQEPAMTADKLHIGGVEQDAERCLRCGSAGLDTGRECTDCGHAFTSGTPDHLDRPVGAPVLSTERERVVREHRVDSVKYSRHSGKAGKPDSLRVTYQCGLRRISEWVRLEHGGFAGRKALDWWLRRDPAAVPPRTVEEGLGRAYGLPTPESVTVDETDKYPSVLGHTFGEPGETPAKQRERHDYYAAKANEMEEVR